MNTPQFNECSQLIDNLHKAQNALEGCLSVHDNPLDRMIDMQRQLQIELAERHPKYNKDPRTLKTCGEILEWCQKQDDYIADEVREHYTSLGGMSNPKPNAIWKPWRAEHGEYRDRLFSDLSAEDQLEAKFELIDQMHFVLNKFIAMGMDGNEIFKLYYLKNAENFDRQERGY
ncbi:gp56 dCTPase [Aeromonas phage 31]|uniref:Gp56 dCTPase n=1 Tax=Aeromonas phage 31 TaxID=321023 RepID=Q56EY6_9CAUD|nr:dUTPase [Aeromonas phage 31]AAX63514.1 gp56 dCTPase [Aeromonas phage 31]APU00920.1 dCTP pyrophosphatase [Aeromonas phage 31.2]